MFDSSNVDNSFRSENEISASSVQDFYGNSDRLFNEAVDAVVAGCVTQYSFDNKEKKFVGTVTSFQGERSYEVKIFVTDDFTIQSANCECIHETCHHIGALALHSGFKTPIFSCIQEETETETTTSYDVTTNSYDETTISHNRDADSTKRFKNLNELVARRTAVTKKPIKKLLLIKAKRNNCKGNSNFNFVQKGATNPVKSTPIKQIDSSKVQYANKKQYSNKNQKVPISEAEWLKIFDAAFVEKLNSHFKHIPCVLRSEGKYSTATELKLQFKCKLKKCGRFYTLSVNRNHKEDENYDFEVKYDGDLNH